MNHEEQEQEQESMLAAAVNANLITKRGYVAAMQMRQKRAMQLNALGDALLELNLSPAEIKVCVLRYLGKPAA